MANENNGGAKRDRTADLLHAMQALYQLSYGPIMFFDYEALIILILIDVVNNIDHIFFILAQFGCILNHGVVAITNIIQI